MTGLARPGTRAAGADGVRRAPGRRDRGGIVRQRPRRGVGPGPRRARRLRPARLSSARATEPSRRRGASCGPTTPQGSSRPSSISWTAGIGGSPTSDRAARPRIPSGGRRRLRRSSDVSRGPIRLHRCRDRWLAGRLDGGPRARRRSAGGSWSATTTSWPWRSSTRSGRRSLVVPDDMAVTGFDGIPAARQVLATAHDGRGPLGRGRPSRGRDADRHRRGTAGCRHPRSCPSDLVVGDSTPPRTSQIAGRPVSDGRFSQPGIHLVTQAAAAPAIELVDVTKRYGDAVALDGISLQIEAGRVLLPARTVRLRQDDDPQPDRRVHPAHVGRAPDRGSAGQRPAAPPAQTSTPSSRTTRCSRTCRSPTTSRSACGWRAWRDAEVGQRVGEYLELVGLADVPRPLPGPAVGRTGAARRARAGAGQATGRAAARRAARGARPQAPQADAGRAVAHPPPGRHDLRVRDPRPGGSAVDGDADRGHGRRARPPDRIAARDLPRPGRPVRGRLHRRIELPRRSPSTEDGGAAGVPAARRDDRPGTGERRTASRTARSR